MQPHPSLTSKEILTMASSLSELKIKFLFSFINVIFILDIANLKDIIEALKKGLFPNHRWSPLGLQLGLLQPTLSTIKANHRDDVESCLQECLTLWLSKADKVTESGGPTWDSLASALNKIDENFTAEKITEFSEELKYGSITRCIFLLSFQQNTHLFQLVKCYRNTLTSSHLLLFLWKLFRCYIQRE